MDGPLLSPARHTLCDWLREGRSLVLAGARGVSIIDRRPLVFASGDVRRPGWVRERRGFVSGPDMAGGVLPGEVFDRLCLGAEGNYFGTRVYGSIPTAMRDLNRAAYLVARDQVDDIPSEWVGSAEQGDVLAWATEAAPELVRNPAALRVVQMAYLRGKATREFVMAAS